MYVFGICIQYTTLPFHNMNSSDWLQQFGIYEVIGLTIWSREVLKYWLQCP